MRIGLCLSGNVLMHDLVESARVAESTGWDSVWLGEDYFYRGGATMAAAVAAATERIRIGLGIMTPLPRHPALMAMEIGALQELSQGRIVPGVGAGVGGWMRQMGLDYRSPLSVMREGVELTRRLLAGETVTERGRLFSLDHVRLNFATTSTPIFLGAVGPKALELAGEIADGTILSVLAGPSYVRWARDRIGEGRARAGRRDGAHEIVTYVFISLADTREAARNAVRPVVAEYVSAGGVNPLTREAGLEDGFVNDLNQEYIAGRVPVERISDEIIDRVAAAGPGDHCAEWIASLGGAGADVVALMPTGTASAADMVRRVTAEVLPLLGERRPTD